MNSKTRCFQFLENIVTEFPDNDAVIWRNSRVSYREVWELMDSQTKFFVDQGIMPGDVVALEADYSPLSIACFFALIELSSIVVPLSFAARTKREEFLEVADPNWIVTINEEDSATITFRGRHTRHEYYNELARRGHAGLVLFSSGSTGKSKAAVHDLDYLLEKFHVRRQQMRAITFLLFDHIGGVNTLLYTMSNGGCVVVVDDRSPESVLSAVEQYKVDLLPASPTFLNLLLLSKAYDGRDLRSLKVISYGTEPMQAYTLHRMAEVFPHVTLQQTYGLSELGILRSKSRSNDTLWVKLGGEGYEIRVVDNILQIKAKSAMLGYLNAPSPFTQDGWFVTGDEVEVDGDYFRILGRKSDIINVGGEKVYPAEVESAILECEGVVDAVVYGISNPITGNVVAAKVVVREIDDVKQLRKQYTMLLREKLQDYKIPARWEFTTVGVHSERFKRHRSYGAGDNA